MSVLALFSALPPSTAAQLTNAPSKPGGEMRRPITLHDIVERRQLQEVRPSPDGGKVAFVVRTPLLADNTVRSQLYVTDVVGGKPARLIEEASISGLRWSPDGQWISYLSVRSGSAQLWTIRPAGGPPHHLFLRPASTASHRVDSYSPLGRQAAPAGVLAYEWSPTGHRIAYTASGALSSAAIEAAANEGVTYDDSRMSLIDLVSGSWVKPPTQLRLHDLRSGEDRLIWEIDQDVAAFAWSPDERRLAVSYLAPPVQQESMVFYNHDVGIVTISNGELLPVASSEADEVLPTWSPDGEQLAFAALLDNWNSFLGVIKPGRGAARRLGYGRIGYQVNQLWWSESVRSLIYEAPDSGTVRRGKSALYIIPLHDRPARQVSKAQGHLSGCNVSADRAVAACMLQSPVVPPDPVVIDLADGRARSLARLHPEYEHIELGVVTELQWSNRYGRETNGFLVKPPGYVNGRRYPALVILYGFEGRFIADAEWLTSYPAQAFARDGFVVLLINYPRVRPWTGVDFGRGSVEWGYSPLASIEHGVELLVRSGIADSTRLGILGWSYGCFLAEFALTQTDMFRVASVGNGGDYNPGIYWAQGSRPVRLNYERVMGGPPYGTSLSNWAAFSPALNAHRARAPVLMEFNPVEAIFGLEMLTALRRHDVPVDFVVYPDEGHVFVQPRHRYHSMQRNLDWFNFWLRGRENEAPGRQEQYARWRAMRTTIGSKPFRVGER